MMFWNAALWALIILGLACALSGGVVAGAWLITYGSGTRWRRLGWVLVILVILGVFAMLGWSVAKKRPLLKSVASSSSSLAPF